MGFFDQDYVGYLLARPHELDLPRRRRDVQALLSRYRLLLDSPLGPVYVGMSTVHRTTEDSAVYTDVGLDGAEGNVSRAWVQIIRETGSGSAFSFRTDSRTARKTYVPKWELLFLEEKEDPRAEQEWEKTMQRILVAEKTANTQPSDEPATVHRTKRMSELVPILPEDTLGLFRHNGEPFNFVYKPGRRSDPRLRLLLDHGWFRLKKHEELLWSPVTLEAYNKLYDSGLEYAESPAVQKWLAAATALPDLDFAETCPLFDYQRDGAAFLAHRKRAMLSLSPGLGKTLTAAYAAASKENFRHVLLVCPASLLYFWKAELEKWAAHLGQFPWAVVWHKEVEEQLPAVNEHEQLWVITNPETLTRFQQEYTRGDRWDLLVVDESIMYKHRNSQRSQAMREVSAQIPNVWLLTGAPATRYLDDMWHQLHILDQRGYSSYWRFAQTYCIVEDTQWSTTVVANRRGAEEKLKQNLEDVYFARSQEDVLDLPQWLFEDLDIAMTAKQDAVYEKLRKDLLIHLADSPDGEVLKVKSHVSLMLRSLQVLSNPLLVGSVNSSGKWTALDELMEIYPGPYIVWVNFIRSGELLKESLIRKFGNEDLVALVNGATPMQERNAVVERMQEGSLSAIVLNNAVGKFGFNLTKARTAFFVERMYDDSYFQCLHRNRRIGTIESPVVVNMRSVTRRGKRTVDHAVHDVLDYRTGMIHKLTVGDLRKVLA